MRVTIIPADQAVYVDGVCKSPITMTDLDTTIHAVQWDGSRGEIEFNTDPTTYEKKANLVFTDFAPFQKYVERYNAA